MLPLALLTTFLAAPPTKTVSLELVDAPITQALTLFSWSWGTTSKARSR